MKSRKFLLFLLVFLTSTALLWFGKIQASDWQTLVTWALGTYFAANVTQKATEKP